MFEVIGILVVASVVAGVIGDVCNAISGKKED